MIDRRQIMTGGVLGSVLGGLGTQTAAAQSSGSQAGDRALEAIAATLSGLRDDIRNERLFTEIASIRDSQKTFLRANGKLPDFVEVGVDAWFAIQDWHVRWQQPQTLGRDPQGRLTIALNQTVVIMRPDLAANFVGQPYDFR